jgi:DinB superfamily
MMKSICSVLCAVAFAAIALPTSAQVNPYRDGTPGITGYRSEVLSEVIVQESKFIRLAEAIPAEKYSWRPSPDVRSFAEVFLHVSASNYDLYKMVGSPVPAGVDGKTLEKSTTEKAQVVAAMKNSFAHAKKAITAMPDAELEKSMDWFGGKNTERGVLLFILRAFCGRNTALDRGFPEEAGEERRSCKGEAIAPDGNSSRALPVLNGRVTSRQPTSTTGLPARLGRCYFLFRPSSQREFFVFLLTIEIDY